MLILIFVYPIIFFIPYGDFSHISVLASVLSSLVVSSLPALSSSSPRAPSLVCSLLLWTATLL